MSWVQTYESYGGYPASINRRPMFCRVPGAGAPPAGWVAMSDADYQAALSSTAAAWKVYSDGLVEQPTGENRFNMRSPDGSVYEITIDDAGVLQRRKVVP